MAFEDKRCSKTLTTFILLTLRSAVLHNLNPFSRNKDTKGVDLMISTPNPCFCACKPSIPLQILVEECSLLLKSLHLIITNSFSLRPPSSNGYYWELQNESTGNLSASSCVAACPLKVHCLLIPYSPRPMRPRMKRERELQMQSSKRALSTARSITAPFSHTHTLLLLPPDGFVSTRWVSAPTSCQSLQSRSE